MNIKKIELEGFAVKYIEELLSSGGALSAVMLEELNFKDGKFFTYVPNGRKVNNADQLGFGGMVMSNTEMSTNFPIRGRAQEVKNLDHFLIEEVKRIFHRSEDAVFVIEHLYANSNDRGLEKHFSQWIKCGDSICFFCSKFSAESSISKAFIAGKSTPSFTAVVFADNRLMKVFQKGAIVDEVVLKKLIKATAAVIVGAFDGEGFVIWYPNEKITQQTS